MEYAQETQGMGGKSPREEGKDYKDLLEKVEKRFNFLHDKWHQNGKTAWDIYLGDQTGIPFNILYSNTEIIVPAVFSRKPTARVLRRFDESRADLPARISERMVSFLMDKNLPSYPSFVSAIEDCVLDAALPGQGVARVRLVQDLACVDYVRWDRFVWGFCARWEDCPWEAFASDMSPEAVIAQFKNMTPEQVAHFKTKAAESAREAEKSEDENKEKQGAGIRVWELWNKADRKVYFLCKEAEDCVLEIQDDPLGLDGFWPNPNPLTLLHCTTDTLPRPLYKLYEEQAQELNDVTIRLRKIIKAIKVRGIYASGLEDIQKVFNEDDDNVLVPSSAASNVMTTGKGIEAYIWLMPIDMLVKTAQVLYEARDKIKETIYEILGIGDILRGVTKASETLGAQELKDKWGSLRVNKARERVSNFVRDTLRLMLELAANKTPPEVWAGVTGVKLPTEKEVTQMRMQMQQQAMAAQAQGQQVPPMPQLPPSWEQILQILRDDYQRAYFIDIETNSSVDSEVSGEKQDAAEFLNALGQSLQGFKDIMTSSKEGWDLGLKVLTAVAAKFQLGQDVLEQIKKLPPPGPEANPQMKQQMEQMQKQMQEVQKRGQDVSKEEQLLKDTRVELDLLMKDLGNQINEIQARREQLRRDGDNIQKDIDLQLREAMVEIKEAKSDVEMAQQKLVMAGKDAQMKGKEAAHGAQMAQSQAELRGQEISSELDQKAQGVEMATQKAGMGLEKQAHQIEQKAAQKDLKLSGREQKMKLQKQYPAKPKGKGK